MQARLQKCCLIKLWRIIKVVCLLSVQYYLDTILLWFVYYGNWHCHLKNNKKWCIWSLHLCNFLWFLVIALFLRKLRPLSRNYSNFIYIFKIEIRNREMYLLEVFFFHNGTQQSLPPVSRLQYHAAVEMLTKL